MTDLLLGLVVGKLLALAVGHHVTTLAKLAVLGLCGTVAWFAFENGMEGVGALLAQGRAWIEPHAEIVLGVVAGLVLGGSVVQFFLPLRGGGRI